ncbi:hypothetical protein Nepgr_004667 [Nepenthes gracilis]|uniref:MAR-binding filament-like protein 1 n=1 Tax=Nepenthes gracilis TaxID=150966 RepID=A0AAD3S1Q8_NEPGR|nr:hypothetical protein Nepgr_004667 [Nepenthes gracilis]
MAALGSSSFYLHSSPPAHRPRISLPSTPLSLLRLNTANFRKRRTSVLASSSASSSGDLNFEDAPRSKKSILSDLIQEIEPLDVSVIQKDVPPTTVDAMKRTISGMLGLLPSNQFQVHIEALWEPLSKLLISSMVTGYTLQNAEYRLCLERNLGIHEENIDHHKPDAFKLDMHEILLDGVKKIQDPTGGEASSRTQEFAESSAAEFDIDGLGEMTPEAQSYIFHLQSTLSSVKKELREVKRKNAALHMQQFVGEEKNDLLDYLRSLQPEKVAELSEPSSPKLKETIHSVVHGLLATLSPKMHSKAPPLSEKNTAGAANVGNEDCAELVENTSLHFQPMISLTRDYLARLLFWCMLLGHYLRGLEYRMELMELLWLPSDAEDDSGGGGGCGQVA